MALRFEVGGLRFKVCGGQNSLAKLRGEPRPFDAVRIKLRKDRIVEDSFEALHTLPTERLRGTVRGRCVPGGGG